MAINTTTCNFCYMIFSDIESWKKHIVDCFNSQQERCHNCGKHPLTATTFYELKQMPIQVFTGRCFCSHKCFNDHLRSEGFQV